MARGIDYGLGQTNIDRKTGIRFGVIHSGEVCQAWYDSSESEYGEPTCPDCGNELRDYDVVLDEDLPQEGLGISADYTCETCNHYVSSDHAFGDEPIAWTLDDGEYQATQAGSDCDIFILKSPYYTRAQFCSPCAPGACYLMNPEEDGERAYCFGHDWFEDGKAPYPVYRVSDDSLVLPE